MNDKPEGPGARPAKSIEQPRCIHIRQQHVGDHQVRFSLGQVGQKPASGMGDPDFEVLGAEGLSDEGGQVGVGITNQGPAYRTGRFPLGFGLHGCALGRERDDEF